MKEPLNFSIDEAVNSLNGMFFWQEESEVVESDIQYSDNVLGVTGFLGSEIRELKDGNGYNDEALFSMLKIVEKGSVWKEDFKPSEDNSRATLQFTFIEHPVQNMLGFSRTLSCKKENSSWKIDYSRHLNQFLSRQKGNKGINSYIDSLKRR